MSNLLLDRRKAREYIVELLRAHTASVRMSRSPSNRTSSSSSRIHKENVSVPRRKSMNKAASPPKSSHISSKADNADIAMSSKNASSYSRALLLRSAIKANIRPKKSPYRNHRYNKNFFQAKILVAFPPPLM